MGHERHHHHKLCRRCCERTSFRATLCGLPRTSARDNLTVIVPEHEGETRISASAENKAWHDPVGGEGVCPPSGELFPLPCRCLRCRHKSVRSGNAVRPFGTCGLPPLGVPMLQLLPAALQMLFNNADTCSLGWQVLSCHRVF